MWHGEEDIANVVLLKGSFGHYGGTENVMFDNQYGKGHMWHSSECAVGQGVEVAFVNPVTFVDFIVHTRRDCCNTRYKDVCLYADNTKIACTPSNYLPARGQIINFKDFRIDVNGSPVKAAKYMLRWDVYHNPGDGHMCGQIEELFVEYTGKGLPYNLYGSTTLPKFPTISQMFQNSQKHQYQIHQFFTIPNLK